MIGILTSIDTKNDFESFNYTTLLKPFYNLSKEAILTSANIYKLLRLDLFKKLNFLFVKIYSIKKSKT